jgi:PAS domain-containing protein
MGYGRLTVHPQLTHQQLMTIFGGAVVIFGVLLLGAYLLQRSMGKGLILEEAKPEKVRLKDEAAITLVTVKGVLTQVRAEQKVTQEKLAAAERRAEENARKFELLSREIDFGLMIFDSEGYIAFSNPQVRKVLAVDTWSRRRYAEIFHDMPALIEIIAAGFETCTEARKKVFEFQGWGESKTAVEVAVLPARDRAGRLEFVACIFREMPPPPSPEA